MLAENPNLIFRAATTKAADRAAVVAAGLHVKIGGLEIGKNVEIHINSYTEVENKSGSKMIVRIPQ